MKCLFVYKTASLDITDPMGIMSLIANVKKHGHQSDLYLTNLEKKFFQSVEDYKPDVIGFSVTSGSEHYYIELIKKLRERISFISVFGGPHPTFFPEIIEEDCIDIICRGEGDYALVELLDRLQDGKDYSDIKNLWVKIPKKQGNVTSHRLQAAGSQLHYATEKEPDTDKDFIIIKNPMRPLIQNLDELPFPDRDSFLKYYAYANSGVKHFLASRGCPYDCTYCFNHMLKKKYREETGDTKYCRLRSVDNVIKEIQYVKNRYRLKIVYFHDDIFIMSKPWLSEFAEKYRKNINLPMICYVRANIIDEEIVQYLKKANCITIAMGIESGNYNIRKNVLRRNMTNEQIIKAGNLFS